MHQRNNTSKIVLQMQYCSNTKNPSKSNWRLKSIPPYLPCHLHPLCDGLSFEFGTARSSPPPPAEPCGPRGTAWRTLWGRRSGPWSCCWSTGCSGTGRRRPVVKRAAGRRRGNPHRTSWRKSWRRLNASAGRVEPTFWRASQAYTGRAKASEESTNRAGGGGAAAWRQLPYLFLGRPSGAL